MKRIWKRKKKIWERWAWGRFNRYDGLVGKEGKKVEIGGKGD